MEVGTSQTGHESIGVGRPITLKSPQRLSAGRHETDEKGMEW